MMSGRDPLKPLRPIEVATMSDDDLRLHIMADIRQLATEELMLVAMRASRLLMGQHQYDELNLVEDARDLESERAEELSDSSDYGDARELQKVLRAIRARSQKVG